MENNTIKSVVFGGFDKQDVIQYIEKAAKEAADIQQELEQENEELRAQLEDLREQSSQLREENDGLKEECERMSGELAALKTANQELEPLRQQVEELAAERDSLRTSVEQLTPDAEAYARFRDKLGDIECESRKRAAELEDQTARQMRATLEQFRTNYKNVLSTFEDKAAFINSELRKMEVTLTGLPRNMDKTDADLNKLSAALDRIEKTKE